MKKKFTILIFILPFMVFSQKYYWDFATSGSSCPDMIRTYNFTTDDHSNLITAPIDMATDHEGNAYVIGNYYTTNVNKTYRLKQYAPTSKNIELKHEIAYTSPVSLYLYKISKDGEIIWANTLSSGPNFTLATYNSKTSLAVNPFSGQVYITTHFVNAMYMNGYDIIDLYPKALPYNPSRMMLCFNSDGTYDTVLLSAGILEKPLFSGASSGVVKVSRPIGDVYGTDSTSLYQLNCIENKLGAYVYFKPYDLIGYDEVKQRYISDRLAEYDLNLNKVVNDRYQHQYTVTNKIINYFKAKDGSIYLTYFKENPNSNNYESKYYLIKIDKNLILQWTFQDFSSTLRVAKDTNDNVFILTMPAFYNQYKVSSNSSYKQYPILNSSNPTYTNIYQLSTSTGEIIDIVLAPTNYFNQIFTENLLKIDKTNKLWMASGFINEMEIGNYLLTAECPNNYLPYFHFVGCASTNWKQDRKNLNANEVENKLGVKLYPNPSNGFVSIENPLNIQFQSIELYDLLGKKHEIYVDLNTSTINIELLNNGVYFIKITSNNHTQTYKIIKQ